MSIIALGGRDIGGGTNRTDETRRTDEMKNLRDRKVHSLAWYRISDNGCSSCRNKTWLKLVEKHPKWPADECHRLQPHCRACKQTKRSINEGLE